MANESSTSSRGGILGEKLGMTQVFDENNRMVPVTVVKAGPCVVTQIRTRGEGRLHRRPARLRPDRPAQGHQARRRPLQGRRRHAAPPPRGAAHRRRRVDYTVGQELTAEQFADGARVDVSGTTKGKGTAGVMKRHGFHGVSASHGAHRNHRKPGSIGACATPGHVFKGTRMAGRMGHVKATITGLVVHKVDAERGLLLIKGAVPGPKGSLVFVRSANKGSVAKDGA